MKSGRFIPGSNLNSLTTAGIEFWSVNCISVGVSSCVASNLCGNDQIIQ